jgi:DNA-binding PadR family transcriptional regulator
MKGEPLKGHLDMLLLAALSDAPLHGYAVIEHLRQRSSGTFDLPEGTIYPALHRLERAGHLRSRWSNAAGRRRRVYELTPSGVEALQGQRRDWQRFSDGVAAVLGVAG